MRSGNGRAGSRPGRPRDEPGEFHLSAVEARAAVVERALAELEERHRDRFRARPERRKHRRPGVHVDGRTPVDAVGAEGRWRDEQQRRDRREQEPPDTDASAAVLVVVCVDGTPMAQRLHQCRDTERDDGHGFTVFNEGTYPLGGAVDLDARLE
jgi:hypothetical protein